MTTLDGYPMARAGRAGDALVLSGVASFVGAFLATIGLMLLAPLLARVAFVFGPAEYFALYMLAFCTLGGMASNNQAKSAIAACIGLAIATIGLDNSSGLPRFTYGNLHLGDGIDFLVAIVGLFAVAEVFIFIESHGKSSALGVKLEKITIPIKDIGRSVIPMLRSTGIGFIAGILPGAGASLGSFLAYMSEKSMARDNSEFGKGDPRGVAAPEAGNNAAAGGALVPMLTLGVRAGRHGGAQRRHSGLRHDGCLVGASADAEHHAGTLAFHRKAGCRVGPDRSFVDRQFRAPDPQPAAGADLRDAAQRTGLGAVAGCHDDFVRRHLFPLRKPF